VEIRTNGDIIVLDAGSGIRELGLSLEKEFDSAPVNLTLLLTHTHWDHIQGLPFFLPAYKSKNSIRVLGYEGARAGLATILAAQMEVPFFPVSWSDLPGTIKIEELKKMEFSIGKVRVQAKFLNHPGICVGYRLFTKEGSIAFLPDNEPFEPLKLKLAARDGIHPHKARAQAAVQRSKLVEFLKESDVLILDAQYTDEKYQQHVGWGHGALSRVVSLALEARVKKLFLFHHDPAHDDRKIDEMLERARFLVVESGRQLEVEAAREGAEVWLSGRAARKNQTRAGHLRRAKRGS
jgi:phosphoribosyl 1,2-cyclic phosphodiesterase